MSFSKIVKGAEVKVYISGKLFPEIQSIRYTIDYGETEIYGVDSQFPQEIAPTRLSVSGTVTGVRVKFTGGLQGHAARVKINELLHSPYTSLRIYDRQTDSDLFWLPQMKVTVESVQFQSKRVATFSFNFKGIVPYNENDFS